jgi:hypothetical protein
MRFLAIVVLSLVLICAALGCDKDDAQFEDVSYVPPPRYIEPLGDDDDDNDSAPIPGDDDDSGNTLPDWLVARPQLQNRSLWRQEIDMDAAPWPRNLGAIGVGNGKVFGILGNQYPLGSWHNLGGPDYEMDLKWFTDKEPWMVVHGRYLQPTQQSISRVRRAPIVITTAQNEVLEWTSVNFAPIDAENELAEHALISVWIVRNLGSRSIMDVNLEIDSNFGNFDGAALTEQNYEGRWLHVRPIGVEPLPGDAFNDMWIPVGDLGPREEKVIVLPYVFVTADDDPAEVFEAIAGSDLDSLINRTILWWDAWFDGLAEYDTPDPKFNDLMNGLALAIKVNTASNGGISQMSQYSHVWNRDTHGPSVYYPLVGGVEDLRAAVDYHWLAVLNTGGIANAYSLNFPTTPIPPEPDWDSMGVMGGHTRAEGPTTVVLQYENYFNATADLDVIEERWGMLKHLLLKQYFIDDCLQPFSGDETFEDLLQVGIGENLFDEPDESILSFYSSMLMLRAARFMAARAEDLGYDADADTFADLADRVLDCAEDTFWFDDLGYYAVRMDEPTREPIRQPYEDISTMPLWLDVMPRDAARVKENFESVLDILGTKKGTIVTPLATVYRLLLPWVGSAVQTGMSHGYWLNNLDKMFHPTADTAFERWADIPTAAGFTDEAIVLPDYGHLSLFHEPWGIVGDTSARFRSWESGIFAHAFLFHLTGFAVDFPNGSVDLAPHLPPRWPEFAVRGLAFGEGRFDLTVAREGRKGRRVTIKTDADAAFTLNLTIPLDAEVDGVDINGEPLGDSAYEMTVNDYGRTVVTLAPLNVAAEKTTEVTIRTAE